MPHYDIDAIKSAASGRWMEIVTGLTGVSPVFFDGQHQPCPRCDGTDRFRSFEDFEKTGGCFCNQCHSSSNGDGLSTIAWLTGKPFEDVLQDVADMLGVEPTNTGGRQDPARNLVFEDWTEGNDQLLALWCLQKSPIKPEAVKSVGGLPAIYRKQNKVLALPIFGKDVGQIVGWTIYKMPGGLLPKFSKAGNAPEWVKVKNTHGSGQGYLGTVDRARSASRVWKTEGPTDMLALLSADPTVAAVCNAMGAKEGPRQWMVDLFAGRSAVVIHDADQPGLEGATYADENGKKRPGWCPHLATKAREVRHVQLPYVISETKGRDLRHWLGEGNGVSELNNLLAETKPFEPDPDVTALAKPDSEPGEFDLKPLESDDDPHRLARLNLERYATLRKGRTLRFWRDEWYIWKDSKYRAITEKELRAKLAASAKEEFNRLNLAALEEYYDRKRRGEIDEKTDKGPPKAKKVTLQLVSGVLQATSGMVTVSSDIEPGTWLPTKTPRRYVSMTNGILDLDALLGGRDDVMLPNSPDWFSMVSLPYAFEPFAECPKWLAFLDYNLESDAERIAILQEWAGYLLLPDTGEQKFLVLEGEGSNGKSVYISAITAMLGEANVSSIPLEVFGDRFSRTDTLGKLLNAAGDCGELDKTAEGYLKAFTSGDRMYFDRKGVTGLNCKPTARLMVACNNRPRFADRSQGIWRRMLIVPWRREIDDKMKVRSMDKVEWWVESGELPGILRWAILGLDRLRRQGGFSRSAVVAEALEDYREEMNPARTFLLESLEIDQYTAVRSSSLYAFYKNWATENGYRPLSERSFGKEVKRVFSHTDKVRRGPRGDRFWAYAGLRFAPDEFGRHQVDSNDQFVIA